MRNLSRLTNAANRMEAWRDWKRFAKIAIDAGHQDLVDKYRPPENAGWRTIDRQIGKLKKDLLAAIQSAEQPR